MLKVPAVVCVYSGKMDSGLQVVVLSPVLQLVLEPNDLLQLSDLSVCFMTDERAVKVDSEHDKNKSKWHHDAGGSYGRSHARTYGVIFLICVAFEG